MTVKQHKIKNILLLAGFFTLLVFGVVFIIGLWYEESYDKMVNKWWNINKIVIKNKDVTKEFKRLRLSLSSSNIRPLGLPIHKAKGLLQNHKKDEWQYYRTGLFDGNIRIIDYRQGIFSGDYQIEILDHRTPQWIKLYSDSIEMYLQRILLSNKFL